MPRFRGILNFLIFTKAWSMKVWIPVVSSSLYLWKSVFSFRVDSILKWRVYIKLKVSRLRAFLWYVSQTSRDWVNSRRVRTHEKNSGDAVRRLGTIIQSIFCAQSGANIRLTVWKWSGESRYPGAFPPVLENFGRAFSPARLTATGSPRMGSLMWVKKVMLLVFLRFCYLNIPCLRINITLVFMSSSSDEYA